MTECNCEEMYRKSKALLERVRAREEKLAAMTKRLDERAKEVDSLLAEAWERELRAEKHFAEANRVAREAMEKIRDYGRGDADPSDWWKA